MEYFAIFFPQTLKSSFGLITVSHKKQKERRRKTILKAKELTFVYIPISLFLFLIVACVGSKRGKKQTRVRAFKRISAVTFIKPSHTEHARTKCPSAVVCITCIVMAFGGVPVRFWRVLSSLYSSSYIESLCHLAF